MTTTSDFTMTFARVIDALTMEIMATSFPCRSVLGHQLLPLEMAKYLAASYPATIACLSTSRDPTSIALHLLQLETESAK